MTADLAIRGVKSAKMGVPKAKKLREERLNEAVGVIFLLIGLFTFVSLLFFHPSDYSFYTSHPNEQYRNVTGIVGATAAHYLNFTFGLSAFSIPALFLFWAGCFFLQKVPQKKWAEFVGIAICMISIASIFSLIAGADWKVSAGGVLGFYIASNLETYFGVIGGLIVSVSCLALSLLLATDFLLFPLFERALAWSKERVADLREMIPEELEFGKPKRKRTPKDASRTLIHKFVPPKLKKYGTDALKIKKNDEIETNHQKKDALQKESKVDREAAFNNAVANLRIKHVKVPAKEKANTEAEERATLAARPHEKELMGDYKFPPIDLLKVVKAGALMKDEDLHRNSKILEETLRDFGLKVKIIEVEQGPVITRYELLPAPGVKVNRIVALGDDLALALKTTSVRFLTPIPGKSAMGIEIPNTATTTVYLRELLESRKLRSKHFVLPLLLGKDTSGKPLIADLADMPHLLIAGATGSGKTICLNSVITGMLHTQSPDHLRFIMVDPKMVELAIYKKIPHMLTPVVTDVRKAAATLNWLVSEMERRYRIFAAVGTRNIKSFNQRKVENDGEVAEGEPEIPTHLPYIVLVIDELADLMLVSRDKVETAITRLAQLSRAVGIHLILATQRPSVDVITGVIKANFPARISFKVSSKVDSRTVLDVNGADKLIGKGDMLFLEPGEAKPTRGQGTFIEDEDISKTVKFICAQKKAQYLPEIQAATESKSASKGIEKDENYAEAVQIVIETRQASVSVLQRRLRLGYGRAARIIDMMEQEGIVGPHQGYKSREILVDRIEEVSGSPANDA